MAKRLLNKLLRALNRIWDRTPGSFAAFRLTCDGDTLAWSIADRVLTLTPTGGSASPLAISLDGYSIGSLCGLIGGQKGYTAVLLTGPNSGFSAFALPDQSGGSGVPGGSIVYGATNLAWLYLDAVGSELETAQVQIQNMMGEMVTSTADGEWLDLLGSYYDVPREPGEVDAAYGPRIIAEVTMPRANNKAIEAVLEAALGQAATVTDVVLYGPGEPRYDGVINFDGSHDYNAPAGSPIYGLFDVTTAFDIINGTSLPTWQASVAALVERMRAAGTQMRSLALSGSALTDTLNPPNDNNASWPSATLTEADLVTDQLTDIDTDTGIPIAAVDPGVAQITSAFLLGTETIADTLNAPSDSSTVVGAFRVADKLTAPDDSEDTLSVTDSLKYGGTVLYSGSRYYASGTTTDVTIEG